MEILNEKMGNYEGSKPMKPKDESQANRVMT